LGHSVYQFDTTLATITTTIMLHFTELVIMMLEKIPLTASIYLFSFL